MDTVCGRVPRSSCLPKAVGVLGPGSLAFLRPWCYAATTHKEGPTLARLFLFDLRTFQRIRVLEKIGFFKRIWAPELIEL